MAILATYTQQPADSLDYDIDYTDWLEDGDLISSVVSTVSPTGLTVTSGVVTGGKKVRLWISGGTAGTTYKVTVTITTDVADGSRTKQDEVKFKIKEY